jgi:poly(hydroxyalkanoate) granule-associated protein
MAEAPSRRNQKPGSPQRGGNPRRKSAGAPKATRTRGATPSRKTTTSPTNPQARRAAPAQSIAQDRSGNGWLELVTSMVQAPVGMGRAQAERLVGELVKTGNLGQREAERLLSELRAASERAQGRAQSAADGLDRFIENRIEDVLNRVNIPSRSDIERLNRSVDLLTSKVEALLNRHERSGH